MLTIVFIFYKTVLISRLVLRSSACLRSCCAHHRSVTFVVRLRTHQSPPVMASFTPPTLSKSSSSSLAPPSSVSVTYTTSPSNTNASSSNAISNAVATITTRSETKSSEREYQTLPITDMEEWQLFSNMRRSAVSHDPSCPVRYYVPPSSLYAERKLRHLDRPLFTGDYTYDKNRPTPVHMLFPELLLMIFSYLDVTSLGRAAQVCTAWCDAASYKYLWRGVVAKIDMFRDVEPMYECLENRGIKRVQLLSVTGYECLLRLVDCVPGLVSINMQGCFQTRDKHLIRMLQIPLHQNLSTITELNLSSCKFLTNRSIGFVANSLPNLTHLEIRGCDEVGDVGVHHITRKLKKLTYLDMRSCWKVRDLGLLSFCWTDNMPLRFLGLQDCQGITDDGILYVSQNLHSLRSLDISYLNITDRSLLHVSKIVTLEKLNLNSCEYITDLGISYLCTGNKRLSSLDVSFCIGISDQTLKHISQGLQHLHSLFLSMCQITDVGLLHLSKSLHNLKVLNIGQCALITDIGLEYLLKSCPTLQSIDLYGCGSISKEAKENIFKMPNIRREKVNENLWKVS